MKECEFNIVYLDENRAGYNIKAANLHKLIQKLTSSKEVGGDRKRHLWEVKTWRLRLTASLPCLDEDFIKLFFLTYRAYASSHDILKRLAQVYNGPPENFKGKLHV